MRAMRAAGILELTARALQLAAGAAGFYARLSLKLAAWRAVNRVKFRLKLRGLPAGLARELAGEYDRALSSLGIPGPLQAARLALRRPGARGPRRGGVG